MILNYPKRFIGFQSLEDGYELGVWGSKFKIIIENILKSVDCLLRALAYD
jgi:hypothetical protein